MPKRHPAIPPVHPGEIIRETVFPALGITKLALADALGVSRQTLHKLMTCERPVTPEMAIRLEAVIGSSADAWLRLQADCDLYYCRKRIDTGGLKRLKSAD